MSLNEQLIGAIKSGDNQKVCDVLEQMNVEEVNEKDEYGYTALHDAFLYTYSRAMSLLLAKPDINVNAKSVNGLTPLHVACLDDNLHVACLDGTLHVACLDGTLHVACLDGTLHVACLDDNLHVACLDDILHVACLDGNHWAVDELLGYPGIAENTKDSNGRTPTISAVRLCRKEALRVMLKSPRVDLNVKDNDGKGLEVSVGMWDHTKNKCLDVIQEERLKRKSVLENEKKSGEESILGIGIDNIERISKKVEYGEQRWKENLENRKLKRRDIVEKSALEETFDKEDDDNERYRPIKELDLSYDDRGKLEAAREMLECPVCMETMKLPTRMKNFCVNSKFVYK